MIRGTTPTHYFSPPCDTKDIVKVNVIYSQDDVVLIKKKTADCSVEDSKVSTKLTREETLLFDHNKVAQVQAIIQLVNGDVLESFVENIGVYKLLDDGEIE